jgi:acyl carrier protein
MASKQSADQPSAATITQADIEAVVLQAMRTSNLARDSAAQLRVAADAAIFGPDSPLDSLGLVALLLDIEEGLRDMGCDVVLSDERAMSQKRSPFRTVASLTAYVSSLLQV